MTNHCFRGTRESQKALFVGAAWRLHGHQLLLTVFAFCMLSSCAAFLMFLDFVFILFWFCFGQIFKTSKKKSHYFGEISPFKKHFSTKLDVVEIGRILHQTEGGG